jgi:hypothetical protein
MKGTDPLAAHASDNEAYDRDLNVKGVLWTGAILAVGTIVICVLMWGMYRGIARLERRQDPAPPPLAEERQPQPLPPAPRLQSSPDEDMAAFRAEEDRTLEAPAWIDRQTGTVRLPIDLAMDVLVRRGLPATGSDVPGAQTQTVPNTQGAQSPVAPAPTGPEPPRSRE